MRSGERNTILVAGYYGFHNLGDEMILAALLDSLKQITPGSNISVVSGDPPETRRRHEVEAILWTDLEAIAQSLEESRLVILGGGGLFHDRHDFQLDLSHLLTPNHAGLTFYTDICLMAHLSGVPYVLAGVGVGPLGSQTAEDLTAWCFAHAAAATVRDQHSLDQLSRLPALTEEDLQGVCVAADLAWLNPKWEQWQGEPKSGEAMTRLAVIPRSWAFGDAAPEWESALAEALARVEADEIIFLPFQVLGGGDVVDDEAVCRRLMSHPALSGRPARIEEPPLSVKRVVEVLASCSAVIGMRYHGALAAILAGRAVLAMAYDPKVSALMGEVGLEDWVLAPGQWTAEALGSRLHSLIENRPIISSTRLEELNRRAHLTTQRIEIALGTLPESVRPTRFLVETLIETKLDLLELKGQFSWSQSQVTYLTRQLRQIHTSRYWRVLGWYWSLRHAAGSLWRRVRRAGRKLGRWKGGIITGRATAKLPQWEDWGLPPARPGKVDIIMFPIIDWEFRFQRPQHLARGLAAAGHRIFYLETTFTTHKLAIKELEAGIYKIQLPGSSAASIYRDPPSDREVMAHSHALDQLAHAAGVAEAACLVQFPYWEPLAIELRRRHGWKVTYDCLDDHHGFSTNAPEMLEFEKEVLEKSDMVLATSERLLQRGRQANSNVQLLPNAADVAHFSPASARLPSPPDFPDVSGPVIGYIGAISEWFDFDLLRHAAENLPEALFYLIGDTRGSQGHADLVARPNVIFAGERPYASLPAYLAQFDVCLIPFKDSKLTQATDPVKVYEYLAAGKPVVARDLPELRKFATLIHLVDTPQAFTQAIMKALETTDPAHIEQRQRRVVGHDWAERVGRLTAWVEDLFQPVSLVIPIWNQFEQTRQCLTSLLETTRHPSMELIIVDNASDDPTSGYLAQLAKADERIKVVRLEENLGFAPAVNAGLREAAGEVLGILNNDIILTRGWLSRLLNHLDRDPSIGMIGPVTNSVGNEALLPFDYTDRRRLESFASQVAHQYAGRSAPIPMLAMFCALMPRAAYQQVGELDERFGVGMFEDDDYAIRLRQAGYKPVCARDVFIHHQGQASFDQLGIQRYRAIFSSNQSAFETKWGIRWGGHSDQGLDAYEQAAQKVTGLLEQGAGPLVVVPMPRRQAEREAKAQLDSLRKSDRLVAYWGKDGSIELETGQHRLTDLHWVVMDKIASPILASFGQAPLEEIRLRLRAPRIMEAIREGT